MGEPPAVAPNAEWMPPPGFADYVSHYSIKAIQLTVAGFGLVSLVVFVLWVVPTVLVARSDAYALAAAKATRDGTVRMVVGRDATADAVPLRYRLDDDGGRFTFVVRGGFGRAVVESQVVGGQVVRQRPKLALDWTRPLREQLEPWDRP